MYFDVLSHILVLGNQDLVLHWHEAGFFDQAAFKLIDGVQIPQKKFEIRPSFSPASPAVPIAIWISIGGQFIGLHFADRRNKNFSMRPSVYEVGSFLYSVRLPSSPCRILSTISIFMISAR